ncbi:MAG: hypothetical protein UT63_C0019G0015 [Candidatus Gottesmanbacteria bacterium GW2011_GWC2_39_8]|uniref:SpoVT-AbrB domain-containing protein n=1 Tax=Candidatus Gottesmanbacteria bacterium GW2011_GWC2_39_8 TaxID=1618450 RepID=A0A0G0PZH7_9BACT|nr:MAG: hypothetical protein UT63_C0019G0015 [Candidatus Gottesmanbacteria bacterium GW2011_GWC2_39_8]
MIGLTTITTKGQVTIPEPVRLALGINVGDKVAFGPVISKGRQVMIKIIPSQIVEELAGVLKPSIYEQNYHKVRAKTGKLLGKKYQVK